MAGTRSRRRRSPESIAANFIAAKCGQDGYCVQTFPLKDTVEQTEDEGLQLSVFKQARKYCKWTPEESLMVKNYFLKYYLGIGSKRLPGREEVLAFLEVNKLSKDWKTVQTKVMNEVRKLEKLAEKRRKQWE